MGGCESRNRDGTERFQSDYKLVVDQIKLNKVHWKKFIGEVAYHGVLAHLTQPKINSVMKAIGLEKEYNDENSALRIFLSLLHVDKRCSARDFISIGLLMCYGNDIERAEYLSIFLQQGDDKDIIRNMKERMNRMMVVVIKGIPDLMLKILSNPDTNFIKAFKTMDEGIFAESIRRWIPEGSTKENKTIHKKEELIKWVKKGELDPINAVKVALTVYNSMKNVSTIVIDDEINNDEY